MKTFEEFCEEKKFDLQTVVESSATKRSAVRSHAYPELYGRGQYPKEYFRPGVADAVTYQGLDKGK